MSIIMGALGGAGEAAQRYAETNHKSWLEADNQAARANLDSALTLNREKTIMALKQEISEAPLNRLGAKARELAGQEVPVEAAPVTSLTGAGVKTDDGSAPVVKGLQGDPAAVRKQIMSNYQDGPQRREALAQLDAQLAADTDGNQSIVQGKTRRRTSGEALSAAADDAKVNDPVAYAEYESKIGKPARDERRIDLLDKKEENRATANATAEARKAEAEARRMTIDLAKLDLQQGSLDAQNRRIDALIEHWDRSDENKANGKAGTPDRMGSIINAMNATLKNLDENKPGASKPEADRKEWQTQRDNAVAVRARAMAKLNANFDDAGVPATTPTPAPTPAPAPGARPPLSNFYK